MARVSGAVNCNCCPIATTLRLTRPAYGDGGTNNGCVVVWTGVNKTTKKLTVKTANTCVPQSIGRCYPILLESLTKSDKINSSYRGCVVPVLMRKKTRFLAFLFLPECPQRVGFDLLSFKLIDTSHAASREKTARHNKIKASERVKRLAYNTRN